MFYPHPLIGYSVGVIERFPLSQVWRQFARVLDISQEYYTYVCFADEVKKGWSPWLDMGWCMIDVRGLILSCWDYMGVVVDGSMRQEYCEYFSSHPFPWFTNPVGMGVLSQVVHQ